MTKTKFILFIISVWLSGMKAISQFSPNQLNYSINTGYGTYSMDDMKKLNDKTQNDLPFSTISVDNFNPGFYFGASVKTIFFSKIIGGITYQYYTTGSRIGQKDYSGYYKFDQLGSGHFIGLEPGFNILNKKNISLDASILFGALFSGVKMNEYLKMGDNEDKSAQELRSFSYGITPTVRASIPILVPWDALYQLAE